MLVMVDMGSMLEPNTNKQNLIGEEVFIFVTN